MWCRVVAFLLWPLMGVAADPPPSAAVAAQSPAERLSAARKLLDARGAHRERRVYTAPNALEQVVEFSGGRQHWITEFNDDGRHSRQEIVWDGGRSAMRRIPDAPQWRCNPPIDDKLTEPDAIVTDGGKVSVDGHAAHRFIEKFTNAMNGGRVTHLVDVDDTTGLPLQLTSTEEDGGMETRYVGTYYDIGAAIDIQFPDC